MATFNLHLRLCKYATSNMKHKLIETVACSKSTATAPELYYKMALICNCC